MTLHRLESKKIVRENEWTRPLWDDWLPGSCWWAFHWCTISWNLTNSVQDHALQPLVLNLSFISLSPHCGWKSSRWWQFICVVAPKHCAGVTECSHYMCSTECKLMRFFWGTNFNKLSDNIGYDYWLAQLILLLDQRFPTFLWWQASSISQTKRSLPCVWSS